MRSANLTQIELWSNFNLDPNMDTYFYSFDFLSVEVEFNLFVYVWWMSIGRILSYSDLKTDDAFRLCAVYDCENESFINICFFF